jgi:4-hydroxy-2-oxoheptanedioate aldolase
MINSVLEAGAVGVYVPDVSTAEKAKAVVDVVRFAPLGERGLFGASRVAGYGGVSGADYRKFSNEEVMLGVQIESRQAAENIAAILGVEGIDMVGSGREDLANSLGVTGQKDHPSVLALEAKIFDTARGRGKCISVNLDPTAKDFAEEVAAWKKKAGIITLGHDINIIRKNFEKAVQCARESRIQASGQQA